MANGTLFKGDKIILPLSLQESVIRLAHSGSHCGQNRIKRRIRSHFYFPKLSEKVQAYVENCQYCQAFTDKSKRNPIKPNKVPDKCWQDVCVDLYGPLPSKNYIVVIQDVASRYPVAKIVRTTSAKAVIPVLQETYNLFGNPQTQKTDNGTPFQSQEMAEFCKKRNIEQVKTPPGHPGPNNAETIMKPLGKAMKIGHAENKPELYTLQSFLVSYRDTPHIATNVAPGAMLFRDGYHSNLPRTYANENTIQLSRKADKEAKNLRSTKYNESRRTKTICFKIGDRVLIRNYKKTRKFQPTFLFEKFKVTKVKNGGNKISAQSEKME